MKLSFSRLKQTRVDIFRVDDRDQSYFAPR